MSSPMTLPIRAPRQFRMLKVNPAVNKVALRLSNPVVVRLFNALSEKYGGGIGAKYKIDKDEMEIAAIDEIIDNIVRESQPILPIGTRTDLSQEEQVRFLFRVNGLPLREGVKPTVEEIRNAVIGRFGSLPIFHSVGDALVSEASLRPLMPLYGNLQLVAEKILAGLVVDAEKGEVGKVHCQSKGILDSQGVMLDLTGLIVEALEEGANLDRVILRNSVLGSYEHPLTQNSFVRATLSGTTIFGGAHETNFSLARMDDVRFIGGEIDGTVNFNGSPAQRMQFFSVVFKNARLVDGAGASAQGRFAEFHECRGSLTIVNADGGVIETKNFD